MWNIESSDDIPVVLEHRKNIGLRIVQVCSTFYCLHFYTVGSWNIFLNETTWICFTFECLKRWVFQFLSDRGFTIFWFAVFVPCHRFKPSKCSLFLLLSVSKLQQAFLYCTIGWWTKSQVLCFLSLGAPFRILSFTNWLQHVIFSQPWDEAIQTKCCCREHYNSNLYNHERFKKNETIL